MTVEYSWFFAEPEITDDSSQTPSNEVFDVLPLRG